MTAEAQPHIGFFVNRHFLHDLSVENPVGRVAEADAENVRLELDGVIDTVSLDEPASHRVDIRLTLKASLAETVVFVEEITYRVEVTLENIPDPVVGHTLYVEVPTAFLPIIREILTRNAAYSGYPDMQAGSIDFREIYYRDRTVV